MGSMIHGSFKVASYLFLVGLVATVGVVILVIVGPILMEIDILAEPTYSRIETFMRRMLLYFIVFAIGYVIASWGRRLTMPRARPYGYD